MAKNCCIPKTEDDMKAKQEFTKNKKTKSDHSVYHALNISLINGHVKVLKHRELITANYVAGLQDNLTFVYVRFNLVKK